MKRLLLIAIMTTILLTACGKPSEETPEEVTSIAESISADVTSVYDRKQSASDSMWQLSDGAELIPSESSITSPFASLEDFNDNTDPETDADEDPDIYADVFAEPGNQTLFNFAVNLFQSDDYVTPKHGSGTPSTWCALGGVGKCIDPGYASRETFNNGALTDYEWIDNHSWKEKITVFSAGNYSCCLYKYDFDLFTSPELAETDAEKTYTEYWVIFFTQGEGKPLYLMYFNCDFYTMEQAMDSIVPGVEIKSDKGA